MHASTRPLSGYVEHALRPAAPPLLLHCPLAPPPYNLILPPRHPAQCLHHPAAPSQDPQRCHLLAWPNATVDTTATVCHIGAGPRMWCGQDTWAYWHPWQHATIGAAHGMLIFYFFKICHQIIIGIFGVKTNIPSDEHWNLMTNFNCLIMSPILMTFITILSLEFGDKLSPNFVVKNFDNNLHCFDTKLISC